MHLELFGRLSEVDPSRERSQRADRRSRRETHVGGRWATASWTVLRSDARSRLETGAAPSRSRAARSGEHVRRPDAPARRAAQGGDHAGGPTLPRAVAELPEAANMSGGPTLPRALPEGPARWPSCPRRRTCPAARCSRVRCPRRRSCPAARRSRVCCQRSSVNRGDRG